MTPLLLLAEKVEGLEGPDREVDAAIIRSFGHAVEHPTGDEWFYQPLNRMGREQVPRYTGSLDAAMSLVPEGVRFRLGHDEDAAGVFMAQCTYSLAPTRSGFVVAYSRSDACALAASALRARAAMEAGE